MALPATIHRLSLTLSDVERGVYETLDLRLARHPSETPRYMMARTLAYALSWEPGVAFSKGGLSSTDEAPVSIVDPTGRLVAWIDVGSPSADRLHKASKAADRVALFTWADLTKLRAAAGGIHRAEAIAIWELPADFLDAVAGRVGRKADLELLRTGGQLYATVRGETLEAPITRSTLNEG